jgi:hypothetical protein
MDRGISALFSRTVNEIKNEVVLAYYSNTPPPNAPSTIAKKGSDRTLIDTGEMVGSIETRIEETETKLIGEVGIFDPLIADRARWNEGGTARIPPRPVWGPVMDGPGDRILRELESDIAELLIKKYLER